MLLLMPKKILFLVILFLILKYKSILYNNLANALRNLILDIMSTRINDVAIYFEKLSNSYYFSVKRDKINQFLMKFSESLINWGKNYLQNKYFLMNKLEKFLNL